MLYEVITHHGVHLELADQFVQELETGGVGRHDGAGRGHRITSYNVCYTKLLRVIDLTWQACHTYNIESYSVEQFIGERFGLPTLHLETDYAESDNEQLRVRIEAYLEMLD